MDRSGVALSTYPGSTVAELVVLEFLYHSGTEIVLQAAELLSLSPTDVMYLHVRIFFYKVWWRSATCYDAF